MTCNAKKYIKKSEVREQVRTHIRNCYARPKCTSTQKQAYLFYIREDDDDDDGGLQKLPRDYCFTRGRPIFK